MRIEQNPIPETTMARTFRRWMRTASAGAALAACSFLGAVQVVSAEPSSGGSETYRPEAEAERLVDKLAESDPAIVGLAQTRRLAELGSFLARPAFRRLLESAAERATGPLVGFRLRRRAASVRRDLGELDSADQLLANQGCLTEWNVVGPFDNDSMRAFETSLPPERGASGPYDGKVAEVDWRRLPAFDRGCVYRLGRTVQPSTSAVAYVSGTVETDRVRDARLMVGAQGAYKIWVNGELVGHRGKNLGLFVDNEAWKVRLEEGSNRVLVKLASRSSGSLGFVARLVDPELEPVSSFEMSGARPVEPVDGAGATAESADPLPTSTGQGVLERAETCATESESAAASWCVGLWRRAASGRAATPWRDVAQRLADETDASNGSVDSSLAPRTLARLAGHHEDHGERLAILERARELASDDPWVGLELASAYRASLERLNRRKARSVLESTREHHPGFWPAALKLADWYDSKGFGERALRIVRELQVDDRQQRLAIVRRLTRLESNEGNRDRADRMQKQLGNIEATSGTWAWKRFSEWTSQGKQRAALELARERLDYHPLSRQWGLNAVELLRSLGESKQALARLEEMIEKMPGDVRLRRRQAELLVAADRTEEAISVLEKAVDRAPQNQRIDDYLSALQTEDRAYHEPWIVDDVRSYADRYPAGSFAHDTVIDQTVIRVSPNGLSQRFVQRVDRAITSEGVRATRHHSVSYTRGEERVEVIDVKVHKADGTVLEDYDQWRSGRSKKSGPYYNDQRSLHIQASNVEKGDLVEYRYRVRQLANENFRGDYFGDLSYVQGARPVGFLRYVVEAPKSWDLYFRTPELEHRSVGPDVPGGSETPEGRRVHGFELEEIPAVQTDSRQPGYTDVYDYILVSNKKSWDAVGEWWWNLIEEQLIVNEEIAETVDELTAGLEDDRAKVEAIHNHLVKNTRYLHVGLGIHGWKPYRTTQCFSNKYGDCKDKSSLLKVMLEEAGIETNLVLVRTRRLGEVGDHPPSMHIFNHAINYIPSMDLFVDPTAEFNGTRQLPPMDQDAQALIVRDGGETEFTKLPVDSAADNLLVRELEVDLSEDPTVTSGHVVARGQNAVFYRRNLENPDRRDEIFEKQLAELYSGAELVSANYENLEKLEEPVKIHFEFEGGRMERTSDGRSFIFPYGARKNLRSRYAEQAERDQDLKIRVPFTNETEMRFHLSPDRGFERVPEPVDIESDFGTITIEYTKKRGTLTAEIRYSIEKQRIPVEQYGAFRSFLSRATSELNGTIELTDETQE